MDAHAVRDIQRDEPALHQITVRHTGTCCWGLQLLEAYIRFVGYHCLFMSLLGPSQTYTMEKYRRHASEKGRLVPRSRTLVRGHEADDNPAKGAGPRSFTTEFGSSYLRNVPQEGKPEVTMALAMSPAKWLAGNEGAGLVAWPEPQVP